MALQKKRGVTYWEIDFEQSKKASHEVVVGGADTLPSKPTPLPRATTRGLAYESHSQKDTKKIAGELARLMKKNTHTHARVFGLVGNLGAGKTTFTKEFLRALGVKKTITSPTFVLVKNYPLKEKSGAKHAYHIDAYRLKSSKELSVLGWKEMITSPHHIVLIEWADKVRRAMPKHTKWILFEHVAGNTRKISIQK